MPARFFFFTSSAFNVFLEEPQRQVLVLHVFVKVCQCFSQAKHCFDMFNLTLKQKQEDSPQHRRISCLCVRGQTQGQGKKEIKDMRASEVVGSTY